MNQSSSTENSTHQQDPVVVCAADENFARPLAVTVRSLLENLDRSRTLRLFVVDVGLSSKDRKQLAQSWDDFPVNITWLATDASFLNVFPVSHHVTHASYIRLALPELLPEDIDRTIYLDCDVVVQGDIGDLWDTPLNDRHCLAVQDMAAPYVDASFGPEQLSHSFPWLVSTRPVSNCQRLGISPRSKYFNAGVMPIDLGKWRADELQQQFFDCLTHYRKHAWCWDQYALNVVLSGKWGELDPEWNVQQHLFEYPTLAEAPLEITVAERTVRVPKIVHFSSSAKPWSIECRHPMKDLFFEYLDRTDWKGWRPEGKNSLVGSLRKNGPGKLFLSFARRLRRTYRRACWTLTKSRRSD